MALEVMASRKKEPATLRTMGLFNGGLTPIEEAEQAARDEDPLAKQPVSSERPSIPESQAETAVRWLGDDPFHDFAHGSQVRVAMAKKGVVLMIVRAMNGEPYGTTTLKLSRDEWEQLRKIACEG